MNISRGCISAVVTLGLLTGFSVGTPARAADAADGDLPEVEITDQMIKNSTFDLIPQNSIFDLTPENSIIDVEQEVKEQDRTIIRLTSDLLFEFDKADLTPKANEAISEAVAKIPEQAAVSVDGHTDSYASDDYNMDLSRRRADAVAAVLKARRPDLKLTINAYGESRLLVKEGEGDQTINRRVEISYEAPGG